MKEARKEFLNRIKCSIGNHTNEIKETEGYHGNPGIQYEMDVQKELQKRFRELFGEEE